MSFLGYKNLGCVLKEFAQQINGRNDIKIFGIVSNGKPWEFGYLLHQNFVKYRENQKIILFHYCFFLV